jgi:DNA-binding MarR family transcriptional regulator
LKKNSTQETLDTFTFEVALLFFRMRHAATEYLGQGNHSSGRRSLIKSLGAQGAQTVPQMANARTVSRQHIQRIVDELRREGLVERIPNPAHRRSQLIALSQKGEALLAAMDEREAELMTFLARGLRLEQVRDATEVVRHVRARLESPDWHRLVEEL